MLVAAALGASRPASAAPPADYEARVKRLEQARASAADPASVDEKLLRLHLSALSRAATDDDPIYPVATTAIELMVLGCLAHHGSAEAQLRAAEALLNGGAAPDDPRVLAAMSDPSSITLDPTCAARAAERALAAIDQALPAGDPRRIGLRAALGTELVSKGAPDVAAPILDVVAEARLARMKPGDTSLGFDGDGRASSISTLVMACRQREVTSCHDRFLSPFLDRMEKKLGPGDAKSAMVLEDVGQSYLLRYDASPLPPAQVTIARRLLERALAVQPGSPRHVPLPLAGAYLLEGKYAEIVAMIRRVSEARREGTSLLLQLADESGKRVAGRSLELQTSTAVSLHLLGAPASRELAGSALEAVFQGKGRIVDVEAELLTLVRRSGDAKLRALLADLLRARSQLAAHAARKRSPMDEVLYRAYASAAKKLEAELSLSGGQILVQRPSTLPSLAEAQAALADDEALVEIIQYEPIARSVLFLPPASSPDAEAGEKRRYAAYVLRKDGLRGFADLGEAAILDQAAKAFIAAIVDDKLPDAAPSARALFRLTLAKLLPFLGDAGRLVLSPDGPLATVPFGALVDDEGRHVLARWSLRYLGSGRDLVRATARARPRQGPMVFGDPAFGQAPASSAGLRVAKRGAAIESLAEVLFDPLPATREEATMASAMLGGTLLLSEQASETALRGLAGPSVLHLATHGFFLPDSSVSLGLADEAASAALADPQRTPMLRAGVVLAGFNRHPSTGDDDGLVTALEAASLDLGGTKLLVLSACETGLGDASPGEGIYGLRRALSIAGAETLVMSLWRVPDAATRDLMRGFYQGLGEGLRPSEAMRRTALAMRDESLARRDRGEPLITRFHPYFWASFVVSGDDLPLTDLRVAPSVPAPPPLAKAARGCACRVGEGDAPTAPPLALVAALALVLRRRRV